MDSVSTLPRSGLGEQRRHKPGKVVKLRGYLMPFAGVVHHACEAERQVTFFVFDDDVDQPVTDVISPTLVRASLAMGSIETKDGTLI
jgi:hypothetical protein